MFNWVTTSSHLRTETTEVYIFIIQMLLHKLEIMNGEFVGFTIIAKPVISLVIGSETM